MYYVIFLIIFGIDLLKFEFGQDGQYFLIFMVEFCVLYEVDVGVLDWCVFGEDQGQCSEQWVDLVVFCDYDVQCYEGVWCL